MLKKFFPKRKGLSGCLPLNVKSLYEQSVLDGIIVSLWKADGRGHVCLRLFASWFCNPSLRASVVQPPFVNVLPVLWPLFTVCLVALVKNRSNCSQWKLHAKQVSRFSLSVASAAGRHEFPLIRKLSTFLLAGWFSTTETPSELASWLSVKLRCVRASSRSPGTSQSDQQLLRLSHRWTL